MLFAVGCVQHLLIGHGMVLEWTHADDSESSSGSYLRTRVANAIRRVLRTIDVYEHSFFFNFFRE